MDNPYRLNQNGNVNGKNEPKIVHFNGTNSNSESSNSPPPSAIVTKRKNKFNIKEQKISLPIYGVRDRLLDLIREHETIVLLGETGSGKSTQLPQYIDEERLNGTFPLTGLIGVTQPRRVAAACIALRVSQEYQTGLAVGDTVGYTVRFEDCTSDKTRIKYMTDGILLREAITDRLLIKYGAIILDEAHERTIHTDILFGIVKSAQKLRQVKNLHPLKIIIMSATMDVDHFSHYFNDCSVVFIEGRTFPVQILYATKTHDDYQAACISTLFKIHSTAPITDDVLIFLTGQEEIESTAHQIRLLAKNSDVPAPIRVCTLYAAQSHIQQMAAFNSVPENTRKVIVSTNIAETSLTIPGVKYVIDCGMVKSRCYHPDTGLESLKVERISQAQAWQRCGRAGRESDGICYRLYTRTQFEEMRKNSIPEIQRANLNSIVLQLLALGIQALHFDYMDKPEPEIIRAAYNQLHLMGAIEEINTNNWQLTSSLGRRMAQFPINPQFSAILLAASERFNCLEEALTVVSLLSVDAILLTPPAKREQARSVRNKFISAYGDLVTLLNVYKRYHEVGITNRRMWCHEHFLNMRNLTQMIEVRTQLANICRKQHMVFNSCGSQMDYLRKCILVGLFTNLAELNTTNNKEYLTLEKKQTVLIHPSSVLHGQQPELVVFTEVIQTSKSYLRGITTIEPDWMLEIIPDYAATINFRFKSNK